MVRHPTRRKISAAVVVAVQLAALPAWAATRTLVLDGTTGTFSTPAGGSPWISVLPGDKIVFQGLERGDSIVRIAPVSSVATGTDICQPYDPAAASYNAYKFKRAIAPSAPNELTGPTRRGVSGLWALGPEGGKISYVETENAECSTLDATAVGQLGGVDYTYVYTFEEATFKNGVYPELPGEEIDVVTGDVRRLCNATTVRCLQSDPAACTTMSNTLQNFDSSDPLAIPPGAYLNGLLDSTYANPDLTGVVLRVSWNDIQRDDGTGHIVFDFHNIDREMERAISHGKLVTLDIRAGRYGTPDWIFTDYLDPMSPYHAPWCTTGPCALTPAAAGGVTPIEFKDYYDETLTCGARFRIGHPGDPAYLDAYQRMITGLLAHVGADSRRFAALAHVKVSGLNLQTSEAELPHHCDDQYIASGFPITSNERDASYLPVDIDGDGAYTSPGDIAPDRIVDVWKRLKPSGDLSTEQCWCNPEIWEESPFGYTPSQIYDYYNRLEARIVEATFGRKSLGYQIIQAGFPQADSTTGGFLGDHLYKEKLVDATEPLVLGLPVNECVAADLNSMAFACGSPTGLDESGAAPALCTLDDASTIGLSALDHCALQMEPTVDGVAFAPFTSEDTSGGRYPKGTDQAEGVLLRGRLGSFGNPANPAFVNTSLGKLFTPQHSGLQAMPAEQFDVGMAPLDATTLCEQMSTAQPAPAVLPPQFAPGAVGSTVATFPMTSSDPAIGVVDQRSEVTAAYNGCPNRWIVEESVVKVPNGPPMLTGFQTKNEVRSLDAVESTLMNLVYNTNSVFIELYEDVYWRASTTRGSGPLAAALSTPGLRDPGGMCDFTDPLTGNVDQRLCYSKNLAQWSEELHLRRWRAANLVNTAAWPVFEDPFPTSYSFTVTNPTPATPRDIYVISPARCNAGAAAANPALAANSLVRIRIL